LFLSDQDRLLLLDEDLLRLLLLVHDNIRRGGFLGDLLHFYASLLLWLLGLFVRDLSTFSDGSSVCSDLSGHLTCALGFFADEFFFIGVIRSEGNIAAKRGQTGDDVLFLVELSYFV